MFNPVRNRFALAVGVLFAMTAMPAAAGPSVEDSLALSMSKGIRDRMFWNLSVVSTKTKTKSEEPRDMFEGGVVSIQDLVNMRNKMEEDLPSLNDPSSPLYNPTQYQINQTKLNTVYAYGYQPNGSPINAISALTLLETSLVSDYGFTPGVGQTPGNGYLGTPAGYKAKAGDPSETVALSVGYFLDDGQHWAVEALVLGAPLRATVYGAKGTNEQGLTNGLSEQKLINTKMLPPVVKFGYYFGNKSWPVRPYLGAAAMYAIFFDTKSTSYFDNFQGGKTSVSIKNAVGIGPFLGLESTVGESGWRVGLSVGKIKLKTEATLVTRNTMITSLSRVLDDYKELTSIAIDRGDDLLGKFVQENLSGGNQIFQPYPAPNSPAKYQLTTQMMQDLADYKEKYENGDGSLGSFVRKQKTELSNTILMLNVGRSF